MAALELEDGELLDSDSDNEASSNIQVTRVYNSLLMSVYLQIIVIVIIIVYFILFFNVNSFSH